MGRTRDVSKILTSNTSILSLASASSIYQTKATAGLVLLNTTSFSGVSSTSLPTDTFTSTYNSYRVVLDVVGGDVNFRFRLRASGSDNTTSNYWFGGYYIPYGAGPTLTAVSGGGAATSFLIGGASSASGSHIFDITNPKSSTINTSVMVVNAESYNGVRSLQFRATTSFDSCTFYPESGTITGSYSVYGYNK